MVSPDQSHESTTKIMKISYMYKSIPYNHISQTYTLSENMHAFL